MSNKTMTVVNLTEGESVLTLRQKGFKVRVFHKRELGEGYPYRYYPVPRGGTTEVSVLGHGLQGEGVARCHSKDNYTKKVGVKIALERALDNLRSNKTLSQNVEFI